MSLDESFSWFEFPLNNFLNPISLYNVASLLTNKFRRPIDAKVINCRNIRGFPIRFFQPPPCENYLSFLCDFLFFQQENPGACTKCFHDVQPSTKPKSTKSLTKSCNSMTFSTMPLSRGEKKYTKYFKIFEECFLFGFFFSRTR